MKIARFPRRIETRAVALRLLAHRDLAALRPLFDAEVVLETAGRAGRPRGSLFSFWRWLRRTFAVVYVAHRQEGGTSRIVGYVGLYDLTLGSDLTLALTIFDPADRRRGYGRQSLEALCQHLRERAIVRDVFAEASRHNAGSLAFLRAVGFEVDVAGAEIVRLRRRL